MASQLNHEQSASSPPSYGEIMSKSVQTDVTCMSAEDGKTHCQPIVTPPIYTRCTPHPLNIIDQPETTAACSPKAESRWEICTSFLECLAACMECISALSETC